MRVNWKSRNVVVGALAFVFVTAAPSATAIHKHEIVPDYKQKVTHVTPAAPTGSAINKFTLLPDYKLKYTHLIPSELPPTVIPVITTKTSSTGGSPYDPKLNVPQDTAHKRYLEELSLLDKEIEYERLEAIRREDDEIIKIVIKAIEAGII